MPHFVFRLTLCPRAVSVHDDRPDISVTTQDVLDVVRDHYEGTDFDLSKGLASGNYAIIAGLVSRGGVG